MITILTTLAIIASIAYLYLLIYKRYFCVWAKISDVSVPAAIIRFSGRHDRIEVYSTCKGKGLYLVARRGDISITSITHKLSKYVGTPHDMIYGGGLNREIADIMSQLDRSFKRHGTVGGLKYDDVYLSLLPCEYEEYKTLNYF